VLRRIPGWPRGPLASWFHADTGTIFFTGATASIRGSKGFAAFSSAKFGLRAVAQAMARELGRTTSTSCIF